MYHTLKKYGEMFINKTLTFTRFACRAYSFLCSLPIYQLQLI